MKPLYLIFVLCLLSGQLLFVQGQELQLFTGKVLDLTTKRPVNGASVSIPGTSTGTTTDKQGRWKLYLAPGQYKLFAEHLGYHADSLRTETRSNLKNLNFFLTPDTIELSTVKITGRTKNWSLTKLAPGQLRLSANDLSRVPSLMGEQDPLNNLRSLPGIQSVGEGSGYFYVRGGNADQNLIMLDEAIIYNPSHLLGLFSVINPSVIQSINLYKGGIPSNYGNRLASVIDIYTRDGDMEKLSGEISIGIIASRITLEAPIVKNKLSFLVALRRTQLDLIYPLLMPKDSPFNGSAYAFYDFNGKITWNVNKNNIIWLSGYRGRDQFKLSDEDISLTNRMNWGNQTFSLNGKSRISQRLSLKSTVALTGYTMGFDQDYRDYFVGINSGLSNIRHKEELQMQLSNIHTVITGYELNSYIFKPYQTHILTGGEYLSFGDSIPYRAQDAALFVHHEWQISPTVKIQTGVRLLHFQQRGPFKRSVLDQNGFPVDSIYTPKGNTISSYSRLEPRISFSWEAKPGGVIKFSASRNNQPIHMVPLSTTTVPLDLWIPSTSLVKPQVSDSYSFGWFQDLRIHDLEASIEGFYRNMNNLVDFSEYQTLMSLVKNNIDQQLTFGKGTAFGLELLIRKNEGKTKGWIGYTYSRTRLTFPEINNGNPFAPRHDRTHDLNLFVSRKLSSKWEGSLQFVYATGQPTTIPLSFYVLNGNIVQYFSDKNSVRLPAYHRVDIALTRIPSTYKRFQSSFTFSVYNIYNRLNPFFIYYDLRWDYEKNLIATRGHRISLLPVLPSITWSLRF